MMLMWTRGLSLMLVVFLLSGFSSQGASVPVPVKSPSARTVDLSPFTRVYVAAPVKVTVHTGHHRSQAILHGDARDLARMSMVVKQGVLYVMLVNGHAHVGHQYQPFGQVSVEVESLTEPEVTYLGNAAAKRLTSSVSIRGTGSSVSSLPPVHQYVPVKALNVKPLDGPHRTDQVSPFDQVYVAAPVKVHVHAGSKQPHVTFHGDARDLNRVTTVVTHGVLQIRVAHDHAHVGQQYQPYGAIDADVYTLKSPQVTYREGSAHPLYNVKAVHISEIKQRTDVMPFFDHVYVDAPANVTLHTGHRRFQVTLRGEVDDLEQFHTQVKEGVLYVTLGKNYKHIGKSHVLYGTVHIDIDTQTLRGLTYRGRGTLAGHGLQTSDMALWVRGASNTQLDGRMDLHKLTLIGRGYTKISGITSDHLDVSIIGTSPQAKTYLDGHLQLDHLTIKGPGYTQISGVTSQNNLAIKLTGKPKVQLTGMANMTSLDMDGPGMFSFYWVKSNALMVRAREGARIQLAGITKVLDVELWGTSRFNGRYLRAARSFVKTHDHSLAELVTLRRQHTLALDASDIYFYNLPTNRTDFMGQNGAVLDMRDWAFRMAQEYTDYNK